MIGSFRNKQTQDFAKGIRIRAFHGFASQAEKRIAILGSATTLGDLAALPSNRLEALKGKRSGQYSIRINDQWRICFEWPADASGPENVEIVDCH